MDIHQRQHQELTTLQSQGLMVCLPMLHTPDCADGSISYAFDPDVAMDDSDLYPDILEDCTVDKTIAMAPGNFFDAAFLAGLCFLPASYVDPSQRYQQQLQQQQRQQGQSSTTEIPRFDLMSTSNQSGIGLSQVTGSCDPLSPQAIDAQNEQNSLSMQHSLSTLLRSTEMASTMPKPPQQQTLNALSSLPTGKQGYGDAGRSKSKSVAHKKLQILSAPYPYTTSIYMAASLPSPRPPSPQSQQQQQLPPFRSIQTVTSGGPQQFSLNNDSNNNYHFAHYRSPTLDHSVSPEALSPVSDQGFFEMTATDEDHGSMGGSSIRGGSATNSWCSGSSPILMTDDLSTFTTVGQQESYLQFNRTSMVTPLNASPVYTTSPLSVASALASGYGIRARSFSSTSSSSSNSSFAAANPRTWAFATPLEQILMTSSTSSLSSLNSPISTSSISPIPSMATLTTTILPALPSPLKQYFGSKTVSAYHQDSYVDDMHDIDNDDIEGEAMRISANLTKRKRNRPVCKTQVKSKAPAVKYPCTHPGCKVTCASQPSLVRHAVAHQWRGLYSPVRCEACKSALSNEFSVQRHILRSQPMSLCRRMRVYSIMRSETEVETTVRFYPKRPHGKKTAVIELAHALDRYRSLTVM
ncbi:hypothetical protein BGZ83_005489 [Gryganskiella cystojenkinii]|nr:hypothetical protein BGZ83_005489 [Gryganskiella cystojenkinii]